MRGISVSLMASSLLPKISHPPTFSFSSSLSAPIQWSTRRPARLRIPILTVRAKIREIFMPALSSTMTEGKIVSWIKSEGDVLSKGESVVVVESDKADMDVETFYDGILAAIVVPEGETAPVGAPIGILAESEDEIAEAKAKAASSSSSSSSSSKVASPSPSPPPSPPRPPPATSPPPTVVVATESGPRKTIATPYAKQLAKQHKVDIGSVAGTGPYGRITASDVEAFTGIKPATRSNNVVSSVTTVSAPPPPPSSPPKSAASLPQIPGSTVVPFTTMQAAVSKNMMESLSVPTFRVGYPIITDALDGLYEKACSFNDLYYCSSFLPPVWKLDSGESSGFWESDSMNPVWLQDLLNDIL